MSGIGLVVCGTLIGIAACWLVLSGLGGVRPSLAATMRSLRRDEVVLVDAVSVSAAPDRWDRVGGELLRRSRLRLPESTRVTLRLIERTPERHVALLVAAALLGLVVPSLVVLAVVSLSASTTSIGLAVPLVVAVATAIAAPLIVHAVAVERATEVRLDLRHQLSAFVDMVTMLLAGNTGHEGALRDAARAGDGRLFRELRRRMREVAATGNSLIDALDLVADDVDLPELAQIAATGRLAASEGAPVARSLAAKCSTLRSTIAADQEADARIRTDKVTPPLVAMTVLFMAVIIYPALDF